MPKPSPHAAQETETYRCAMCGGEFTKARSDDEAMAESVKLWGLVPLTDLAIICDDCFQIARPR